jgi:hypothetical protein
LRTYLYGNTCNGECRGKLIDIMLTWFAEAQGRYDEAFHQLFTRPRGEVAVGIAHLQSRLLQCQLATTDGEALRDGVLVRSLVEASKKQPLDQVLLEDLLGLLALTPDPDFADAEGMAKRTSWEGALALARQAAPPVYDTAFTQRRATAQQTRKHPQLKMAKTMFCTAEEVSLADVAIEE